MQPKKKKGLSNKKQKTKMRSEKIEESLSFFRKKLVRGDYYYFHRESDQEKGCGVTFASPRKEAIKIRRGKSGKKNSRGGGKLAGLLRTSQ